MSMCACMYVCVCVFVDVMLECASSIIVINLWLITVSSDLLLVLCQVFIINLLRDSKFYHFRPVMDTHIQKHFAGALAYKSVLQPSV